MQALLWLFMKGRQPRVQTALNTVSATDSQAAEEEKIRQVSNSRSRVSEGWVEAPWPESCPQLRGICSRQRGLSPSAWLLHFFINPASPFC